MDHIKSCFLFSLLILNVTNLFCKLLHVNSLKFQDSSSESEVTKYLPVILQLFSPSSLLCIVSESQEITGIFLYSCQRIGIPFILNDFTDDFGFCNAIIALETNNFTDCYKMITDSYKSSIYFLNFYSDMNFPQIEKCFSNSSLPEVLVVSNGSIFELSPVFSVPRRLKPSSITQVLEHRREKYRLDLGGSQVSVAFITLPPVSIFPDLNKPETGDGIEVTLVKELSLQLNFTMQFKVYDNWGQLMSNGTWYGEGLAVDMQERKADVAVTNIWQIPSFYKILDFGPSLNRASIKKIITSWCEQKAKMAARLSTKMAQPLRMAIQLERTMQAGINISCHGVGTPRNSVAFLVRRPVQIDFQWRVFMTIFQPLVWILTLVAFAVMVVVYHVGLVRDLRTQYQSWAASVLTIFGHFTMTTSTSPAHSTSSRPLLTAWSVFSLLLTTSLSTGIVSRLTLPLYSPRVDTYQQLVQGGFHWTLQSYKNLQAREIKNVGFDFDNRWSREFEQRFVYMQKEQIEQAIKKDEKLAFPVQNYGDDFFIIKHQGLTYSDLRNFRQTKQFSQGCHLSWGVKKHSPLLRPLTAITHRFIQAGLTKQWRDQVFRRWPRYDVGHVFIELDIPTFGEPEPLKLAKVKPILYLLLIGLALATLVFFIEISW